jgi:predicted transcriptional regulator
MADIEQGDLATLTVQLLSAYVANNSIQSADLAALILSTREALSGHIKAQETAPPEYVPAVSVRKSLASRDHILSMIDGKPYKTLKRHLASRGLSPVAYRERYNLPKDYPMVSPGYSEQRRDVALKLGLGSRPDKAAEVLPPASESAVAPPRRGRPRKTQVSATTNDQGLSVASGSASQGTAASKVIPAADPMTPGATVPPMRGKKTAATLRSKSTKAKAGAVIDGSALTATGKPTGVPEVAVGPAVSVLASKAKRKTVAAKSAGSQSLVTARPNGRATSDPAKRSSESSTATNKKAPAKPSGPAATKRANAKREVSRSAGVVPPVTPLNEPAT